MNNEEKKFENNKKVNNNTNLNKNMNDDINLNETVDDELNIHEKQDYHSKTDNTEDNLKIEEEKQEFEDKETKKEKIKPFVTFGIICIVIALVALFSSGLKKVDTSDAAKDALKNKVSTAVSNGTILLSKDENIESKDYTIEHKSDAKDTKIWVWDYASEDGDYVQIIVNGTPMGEAFKIKNKPKEFTVPLVGEVQIKGIRDGGGGITYAVRYDFNQTTYFNSAPQNEFNTYTLIKN